VETLNFEWDRGTVFRGDRGGLFIFFSALATKAAASGTRPLRRSLRTSSKGKQAVDNRALKKIKDHPDHH